MGCESLKLKKANSDWVKSGIACYIAVE